MGKVLAAIIGLPQQDIDGENYFLFNSYSTKKMAKSDQEQITRFKTKLIQAKNGRWYLYQKQE